MAGILCRSSPPLSGGVGHGYRKAIKKGKRTVIEAAFNKILIDTRPFLDLPTVPRLAMPCRALTLI
jgi:hypothetical protein